LAYWSISWFNFPVLVISTGVEHSFNSSKSASGYEGTFRIWKLDGRHHSAWYEYFKHLTDLLWVSICRTKNQLERFCLIGSKVQQWAKIGQCLVRHLVCWLLIDSTLIANCGAIFLLLHFHDVFRANSHLVLAYCSSKLLYIIILVVALS
jgi:hypothetical protein